MQTWCVIIALIVVGLLVSSRASAQDGYPGGFTLMPIDPGPVQLLSMTVDASVRDDGEQSYVDVTALYRVHNTDDAQPRTLSVAFPGYAVEGEPPTQVSLTAEGKEVVYSAAQTQWWIADVALDPDQRLSLALTYSVPLGSGPFVRFRYPMDLVGQQWPGRLESARFTLAFSEPPNPQSWIKLTPEDYKLTAEAITWSYDTRDPQEPIDYIFMRPGLWSQLRSARQQAAAPDAPASAHIALGDIYTQLATTAGEAAIFERYFPLAVASYTQAQQLTPDDPTSYLALARLYRGRAELSQPPNTTFVALAVNELASALENGATDPSVAEAVAKDFAALIERARMEGDFDAANAYLARLEALAQSSQVSVESADLAEERRRLSIDWAAQVLQDQGPGPAREVLASSFGPETVQPESARFARLNSVLIDVDTKPGLRTVQISAAPRVDAEPFLQEMAMALEASKAASVTVESTSPALIRLAIPFADANELRQRQQALAAALPQEPEWAALLSVLRPAQLDWTRQEDSWRTRERFEEQVDFVSAVGDLSLEALTLETAATSQDISDPLGALLAEIWRAEADAWRRLADNQRARFTLTLYPKPGAPSVQTWSLDQGEAARMAGDAIQYRVWPFILAAVVIYALFVLLTWLIWRRSQRP